MPLDDRYHESPGIGGHLRGSTKCRHNVEDDDDDDDDDDDALIRHNTDKRREKEKPNASIRFAFGPKPLRDHPPCIYTWLCIIRHTYVCRKGHKEDVAVGASLPTALLRLPTSD
ncbi:hypothetical protein V1478_016845 [Vespula squamosa]|uniref:Uncharacterized protein n=1 Tax=Vespula squamosa TaxID=30214 RepID=A0ABD2A0X6_VESSQ